MKTMHMIPVLLWSVFLIGVLACWTTAPAWSQVHVSQWEGVAKQPPLRSSYAGTNCSIFAEVEGAEDPGETDGGSLRNGPFTITTRSGQKPLGDGVDEDTQWTFSDWMWSDEPDEEFTRPFNSVGDLTKADLTLGISTKGGEVNTDWVEIDEDDFGNIEEVKNLPGNTTLEFDIDLLDYSGDGYTSEALINLLVSTNGRIKMLYSDDAVIFYAKLELTFDQGCPCISPEDIRWNNPGGGPFTTEGNWLDLEVPGEEQNALFDLGNAYTVTFGDSPTSNALRVENDGLVTLDLGLNTYTLTGACGGPAVEVTSDAGTLTVKNGTVTARHDVLVHEGLDPELIVSAGGDFLITGSHDFNVGSTTGGASVTVEQGGLLDNDGTSTLGHRRGSRGEAFVKGDGAFFSKELIVGEDGIASLTISEGGEVAADDMTFVEESLANGSTLTVSDKGELAVDRLEVAHGQATRAVMSLSDQGTLLEIGEHVRLGGSGEATLRLEGEAAVKEVGGGVQGELVAGFGSGSRGTLEMMGDGTLLDLTRVIIAQRGEGFFTVEDDAEALMDELLIGRSKPGEVTLLSGGQLSTSTLQMGVEQGGTAQLTITGTSSSGPAALEVNRAEVGLEDAATLRVASGGEVYGFSPSASDIILGAGSTGSGTLDLEGVDTRLSDLNQVVVGGAHTGTMTVTSQAEVSGVNAIVLGQGNSNAGGTLEVSQQGRIAAKTLTVGEQGGGTVLINDGGIVEVEDGLALGVASAATGNVTVSGIGSELNAAGTNVQTFAVGEAGTGTLRVINGADLVGSNRTTISLGRSPGGTGTMQVLENGTLATNFRRIAVGDGGSGVLEVSAQGTLDAQFLWIPRSGGMGTATVFGQGSTLTAQRIFVGQQGQGSLTVDSDGTLTAQLVQIGAQGTFTHQNGILNVGQITSAQSKGAETGLTTDTLFVAEGATLAVDSVAFHPGGVLGGAYTWDTDLVNEGTITPGDSIGAAGTFTVEADYEQAAGGVLHVELGAAAHDVLAVSGTATLGGVLRLSVPPGETINPGQTFEIVRAGSVVGAFAHVEHEETFTVEVSYGAQTVEVMIVTAVAVEEAPGTEGVTDEVPTAYALSPNYPNPFNPLTTIRYAVPEAAHVRLLVYDLVGRRVAVLVERLQAPGTYEVTYEASGLPSGTYLYRLEAGTFTQTRPMTLMK